MSQKSKIVLRSSEVNEILSNPPAWLVRWGSLTTFFVTLLLVLVGIVINYPVIVEGDLRGVNSNGKVEFMMTTKTLPGLKLDLNELVHVEFRQFSRADVGLLQSKIKSVVYKPDSIYIILFPPFGKSRTLPFQITQGETLYGKGEITISRKNLLEKIFDQSPF